MPIKTSEQQDATNFDSILLSQNPPMQFLRDSKDFFFQYMQRQFPDLELFQKNIRPVLSTILAAYEPLPVEFIQHLFNWQNEELRDFIRSVGSLFPVTDESGHNVIKPYIPSLSGWLTDESQAGLYFINLGEGHRMLADIGWRDYGNGPHTRCPYFLHCLPLHLLLAERTADAIFLLDNEEFHALRVGKNLPYAIRIEETKLRFPAVAQFIACSESSYQMALTMSDDSPANCDLSVYATDFNWDWATKSVARFEQWDGDIFRHWDYLKYDVVTVDGERHCDCVPVGKTLAEVLPLFEVTPSVVIQTEHLSGECDSGHDVFGQREWITLFRVPQIDKV